MYRITIELSEDELKAIEAVFFMQLTKGEYAEIRPQLVGIWNRIKAGKAYDEHVSHKVNLIGCMKIGIDYIPSVLKKIYEEKFTTIISEDELGDLLDEMIRDGIIEEATTKKLGRVFRIVKEIKI